MSHTDPRPVTRDRSPVSLVIASFLEPDHVERIRAVDGCLDVRYAPELLPPPRYAADHVGGPLVRSEADETRWRAMLAGADILFDFDRTNVDELPRLAPRVRWIQATSAGIGQFVARHGYAERMLDTVFTTASGVHARPLAEFCIMSMTGFSRGLPRMVRDQRDGRWERFAGFDLEGKSLLVYGYGAIGTEIGRLARALGMRVIGIRRSGAGDAAAVHADELHGPGALDELLPRADFLVLAAPHTPETERIVGAAELALLPSGAVLINVGRGALVDETALVESLRSGHLDGASLDVFEEEPLPASSPLWRLPNVFVSPHSAGTSERENERITDLFCDNLRRFLDGEPLLNVLDPGRLY
jgi:phosphoglycerate dehydrogenase-like enzyme